MARFSIERGERGHLETRVDSDGSVQGFYIPRPIPGDDGKEEPGHPGVKLLEVRPEGDELRIYPLDTRPWDENFLKPKYSKIHVITVPGDYGGEEFGPVDFADILEELLPSGLTKDPEYGLGLARDNQPIIDLIEEHCDCSNLELTGGAGAEIDGSTFRLGLTLFDSLCAELRRIKSRGDGGILRVKRAVVHNALAETLGLDPTQPGLGRHQTTKWMTAVAAGQEPLGDDEREDLLSATTARAAEMASKSPERMVRLQRDIELVNLDQLIGAYEDGLKAGLSEPWWQRFLEENLFILQLLFGGPAVFVDSQVPIGADGNSSKGKKIADYLFKNALTQNAALVEIKKPSTQLMNRTPYREGVYGVHSEVTKSVTQVLDQALQLTRHEAETGKRISDESWLSNAPRCFVVAGRTSELDSQAKKKSFDLFREHLSGAQLVTYDELLEQLKLLRDFLAADKPEVTAG